MNKPGFKVYTSVSTAMLMWSLTFVFFKITNEVYQPVTIVFFRVFICTLIFLLIAVFSPVLQKLHKQDMIYMFLLSMFTPVIYFLAEGIGLSRVSASVGAVIVSTIPLFVPLGAFFFFGERLSPLNITGMFVSFSGVLLVILTKGFTFSASPVGVLFMFLAVISAASYTLMAKRLTYKYSAYTITAWQSFFGALIFLPLFLFFDLKHFLAADHNLRAVSALLYLAVFGSLLAFILFNYSIKIIGAARTDFFTNMIPVLTVIFAYFILGEPITFQKVGGMFVVLTGLIMSQWRR